MSNECRIATLSMLALMAWATATLGQATEPGTEYEAAAAFYNAHAWQNAADSLGQFAVRYPEDPRALQAIFYRAEALTELGHYPEAIAGYQQFLAAAPANAVNARQALFRLGECNYQAGEIEAAIVGLEAFRRGFPDDPLLAYALPYLADLKLQQREPLVSASIYKQALEMFPAGPLATVCQFGCAGLRIVRPSRRSPENLSTTGGRSRTSG